MADIGTAYVQIEPTAKGISKKIEGEFASVGSASGKSFSSGFGSVLGGIGKVAIGAVGAGVTAVSGLVASATKNFADYEQLVGGVETLFKDSAGVVQKNADEAFKTAGLSANDYMETVTSFSASLLQSLGGDTKKSADYADQAIIDMSDNANKMGTSMEMIQNAYQGFAKQNYTMLDNLKLGYGGTKTEMERLLADAEKMGGMVEGSLSIDSFADVVQAIHIVQDNMGITGTTAKEAATTISGSLASVKASWENLMTGMANGDDLTGLIDNLVSNVQTFAGNVIPVVTTALTGVSSLISQLAPVLAKEIPGLIESTLPSLLNAGVEIVKTLGEGILNAIPTLMPTITNILLEITQLIISMLPQLVEVGIQILSTLAQGIIDALPTLIPAVVDVITQIVQTLIDNAPLLIEGAIQLFNGLVLGLVQALPQIISALPTLIQSIVDAIVTSLPLLIQGTIQLIMGLIEALPAIIQALIDAMPMIIQALVDGLITALPLLIEGNIQLMTLLIENLPTIIAGLIQAIPQIITSIVQVLVASAPAFISAVQNIVEQIKTFVTTFGGQFLTNVSTFMSNLLNNIKQWLAQLPMQMAYFAGQAIGKFMTTMLTLPSKLAQLWNTIITNLKAFGERMISTGAQIVREFAEKFIDGLKALPGRMLEIGSAIVEGLKNGITGAWSSMTSFVSDLGSNLLKGFKDSLQIGSPSRVMRDEVGRWIPAGIAEGIRDGMGLLDEAVNTMSTSITPNLAQSITPYAPAPDTSVNQDPVYGLLSQYLPIIASGERVFVELNVDNDRLFRIVQAESRRNTQLVGVNA